MSLISLSSICPPYHNQSNSPTIDEEIEVRQPLVETEQADEVPTTTDQLLSYIEERVDPKGHWECILSVSSTVMTAAILLFHGLEKYNENHKEILGTQIINIVIIALVYAKRIFSCTASSVSASKTVAKWWQSRRLPEQAVTTENLNITAQPTNCFSSAFQYLKNIEKMDDYFYYALQAGCFIIFFESVYLHRIEKDDENHALILGLDILNVVYSGFLSWIQIKKTMAQNRMQSNVLPLDSIRIENYQTI